MKPASVIGLNWTTSSDLISALHALLCMKNAIAKPMQYINSILRRSIFGILIVPKDVRSTTKSFVRTEIEIILNVDFERKMQYDVC